MPYPDPALWASPGTRARKAPPVKRLGLLLAALVLTVGLVFPTGAQAQGIIRDAEIEDTLRVYAEPILAAAELDPKDVAITIVGDPSLNAFVARGQRMFIHTGLILAAETPNQLIGVMAHETGHIAGGHLARMREAAREAAVPAYIALGVGILAIAAGAPEAGVALLSGAPQFAQGQFVQHTQVQESAADQAAVTYLDATGQSGRGLIEFFNRQFRPNEFMRRRIPPYLQTHPFSSDRIEALRQRVEASPHYAAPEPEGFEIRFAMMQAKLIGFLRPPAETMIRYPSTDASLPARYARAIAVYRDNRLSEARTQIAALIAEQPENPYFQELMGQVLFENALAEESVPYHRQALALSPNQPLLQINLARALLAAYGQEGADEAVTLLQAASTTEPTNGLAWRELARAYDLLGQDGLARLASAEQAFAGGNFALARNFAERARRELEEGTVAYRQASDIIASAETGLERAARRGN